MYLRVALLFDPPPVASLWFLLGLGNVCLALVAGPPKALLSLMQSLLRFWFPYWDPCAPGRDAVSSTKVAPGTSLAVTSLAVSAMAS
jgi:hypothetical protein